MHVFIKSNRNGKGRKKRRSEQKLKRKDDDEENKNHTCAFTLCLFLSFRTKIYMQETYLTNEKKKPNLNQIAHRETK